MVAAISDLLSVKIPSSYEVSSTPDRGARLGPPGLEAHAPMLYHGQRDNGGLHIRPGQMMRSSGGQEMMQQQAHAFPFHLNRGGEKSSIRTWERGQKQSVVSSLKGIILYSCCSDDVLCDDVFYSIYSEEMFCWCRFSSRAGGEDPCQPWV